MKEHIFVPVDVLKFICIYAFTCMHLHVYRYLPWIGQQNLPKVHR